MRRLSFRDPGRGTCVTARASISMARHGLRNGTASNSGHLTYPELVEATWRHSDGAASSGEVLQRELVRYATLAANSHNTQPWRFRLEIDRITVLPDLTRRCPVVDPDDHHLFVSLGCAVENLVLAAEAYGLRAHVAFDEAQADAIHVDLEPASASRSALFQAIPERQSTRTEYDGKPVPSSDLALLETAVRDHSTTLEIFTVKGDLDRITDYVVAGNAVQLGDRAFTRELKTWLRFSKSSAVKSRDGLFAGAFGSPTLPNWLGKLAFDLVVKSDSENDKYRAQIASSAGVAAFISEKDDKASWVEVGRAFQRFALQATVLGIKHAHVNQAVEVPEVRVHLADYLGLGQHRPDLLVRFGYGPEAPRSLRRPIDAVLAGARHE